MINVLGQVMLYVNDQEEAVKFWTEKVGFRIVAEETEPLRWIEIAPQDGVQTSIVLHNKALIAEMQPELHLGTPSLLFFASNLDELYETFQQNGVTVGELVTMPFGRVFNFADSEQNYFAILEK